MLRLIRGLRPWAEFAIVILVAFGYFAVTSILVLFHPLTHPHHSSFGLVMLVVYELGAGALLCAFLWARGWSLEKIGFAPSLRDTGIGLSLAMGAYLIWAAVWGLTVYLSPDTARLMVDEGALIVAPGIPLAVSALVSLVNPVFEEVFVTGYVITVLRGNRSPIFALNVSVAIRLIYHLYQGSLGVISIIPIGLIFGYWYVRTARLWPIIVAHGVMDLIGLLAYSKL